MVAAGRREPRDVVDLLAAHDGLLPLGAVVWAAVGKSLGFAPAAGRQPASGTKVRPPSHLARPEPSVARCRLMKRDAVPLTDKLAPNDRAVSGLFRFLELVMVLLLAGMIAMVFGNVVLRYAFNSGIEVSEELSRFFFIWLTFIGAVVVMREGAHMGVDALVAAAGPRMRVGMMIVSDALVLLCCAVFFWGTLSQAGVNASNTAPVTGLNMLWVFGVGIVTSVGMFALVLPRFLRAVAGRARAEDVASFAGERGDEVKAHLE